MSNLLRVKATGNTGAILQGFDKEQIRQALALLLDREGSAYIFSIRGLRPNEIKKCDNHAAKDIDGIIEKLSRHQDQESIYLGLNSLPLGFKGHPDNSSVTRRRWIFIDIDAGDKKNGYLAPATEEEHDLAQQEAEKVRDYLTKRGWPAPVQIDSGNGWYLLYRVDLPNDDLATVAIRDFLKRLRPMVTGKPFLDTSVHDARRIARLPGTLNCKGTQREGRIWRPCRLVSFPLGESGVVSYEMIRAVAGEAEIPKTPSTPKKSSTLKATGTPSDRDRAIEALNAIPAGKAIDYEDWLKVGMALHSVDPSSSMCNEWDQWSASRAIEKYEEGACQAKWRTFKSDGGITIASLIHWAKEGGWTPAAHTKATNAGTSEDEPSAPAAWELCVDDEVIADGDAKTILEPVGGLDDEGKQAVFQIYTGPTLMRIQFPPPAWVIQGLLSEGLNVLAGKPKMGKSIMALNLALTISGGGHALGNMAVEQGDVLYLALEDKFRRVQGRAKKMVSSGGMRVSGHFGLATDWPRCDRGGLRMIDEWLRKVNQPRLVIIDVWAKFKPGLKPGSRKSAYDEDYEAFGQLKTFVDKRNINCLLLLHCRKGESEDVLDEVSGTLGQVGAADGIIILHRSRKSGDSNIFVVGRDADEQELSLAFDLQTLTWKSLGPSSEHVQGKLQTAIIEYLKTQGGPRSARDIATAMRPDGKPPTAVEIETARVTASRLADKFLIDREGSRFKWPGPGLPDQGLDEGEP